MEPAVNGPVTIRDLRPEDAEALGVLLEALDRDPASAHFHPFPLTRATAAAIAERLSTTQDLYFGAFVDSRLAGFGMLRGWDEGYAVPSFGVAVESAARGRGLGRGLLRFAIRAARGRGAPSMMLKVHVENPARHLYEAEGFHFPDEPGADGQVKGTLRL